MMILKIIAKIFIEISFLCGIIEYDAVFQLYEEIFRAPASMMTMDFGSIELVRVQSPSDIVVASLLPFYLIIPNEKEGIKIFNFLMLGIYTLIVFSRVYIVEFACFMFVAVVFYWKKIPKKVRYGGIGIIAISSLVWFRPMVEMLCFRFFSDNVAEADSVRTEQIRELVIGIKNAPIWGHGMGSFLPDLIRSEEIPFSYEAEYLSFVYQLGIVGFIILIVGILCIYLKRLWIYVRNNSLEVKVFSFVCISWLLIRPAFNPSFLGLQNGFPVIGLLLLNAYFNEKSRSEI
ncbi:O-antigen ligase family protein [Dorea formicigenerans]|nr:O-antigen ligase family protein [Dorea formicigenerans]